MSQQVDQIYGLITSLSNDELKEFVNDTRSDIFTKLLDFKYAVCNENQENDFTFWLYDIIVDKIDNINAKSLFFLKETFNNVKSLDLNIMQMNKMIKDCEQPFVFFCLPDCHEYIRDKDKTIKMFAKNGIHIKIEKHFEDKGCRSLIYKY